MNLLTHGLRLLVCATTLMATSALSAPEASKAVADKKGPSKAGGEGDPDPTFVVRSSTRIDFNEINIDGKMKAPEGFYLQGRRTQKMQNLLRLRQDFKKELAGSGEAAQTEYK